MYYHRLDVRRAITNFAGARGSEGVRECAFYNSRAKSIQRYFREGEQQPVALNATAELNRALALGASAFYCSYWRYQGRDFSSPAGRDLVWAVRAKHGGLKFAKTATVWVVEALADAGAPEPWVKYSGDLGFDLVLPLETIPCEAWDGGADVLSGLQGGLTDYIASYLREQFQGVTVDGTNSSLGIKRGTETCLLSELRARRGLLLAPMSLCPETGLVSVTLDPKKVSAFSVFDASPSNARLFEWESHPGASFGLMKYFRQWQPAPTQTELTVQSEQGINQAPFL